MRVKARLLKLEGLHELLEVVMEIPSGLKCQFLNLRNGERGLIMKLVRTGVILATPKIED